jgi:hypothetical protein
VAGAGQVAAGNLGQLGQQAAGNVTNLMLGSGQQIGQSLQNAGAARASGYAAIGNAAQGAVNSLGQLIYAGQTNPNFDPWHF